MPDPVNIILIVLIVLILAFAVIKGIKKAKGGCCGSSNYRVRKVKAESTDKSVYHYLNRITIEGMTCNNCKTRVENAFNRKGHFAKVSLREKCAKVYSFEPLTKEQVMEYIARDGYILTDIKTEKL